MNTQYKLKDKVHVRDPGRNWDGKNGEVVHISFPPQGHDLLKVYYTVRLEDGRSLMFNDEQLEPCVT